VARCGRSDCRRWWPDFALRIATRGFRVDHDWFCSPACIAAAAEVRFRQRGQQSTASATPTLAPVPALRLGVLLLHQGAITSASLTKALKAQKESGLRLGAQLLQLGLATQESILRGLSAQAGISYLTSIDASRVRQAPGGLSTDEIRALGIVPFGTVEAGHQMMVACQAPVPRAALSALRQLTGWNPEPFLVSDVDFAALMQGYGIAAPTPRRVQQLVKVRDIADAADRIAGAAASSRSISITEADLAPFRWVRIDSRSGVETLLVPFEQEPTCQAAFTSH
jgi:hypothetical protein